MTDKLKPCPFCGAGHRIRYKKDIGYPSGDNGYRATIECINNHSCGAKIEKWASTAQWAGESAVKAWNSRAEEIVEALEKQTPKKAKISLHGSTDWNTRCRCPVCGKDLFDGQKHCSECGQLIDWGEVNDR